MWLRKVDHVRQVKVEIIKMLSLTAYDNSDSGKSGSSSDPSSSSEDESSSSASSPVKSAAPKKGKVIIKAVMPDTEAEGVELPDHLKPLDGSSELSTASQMRIVAAPDVVVNVSGWLK